MFIDVAGKVVAYTVPTRWLVGFVSAYKPDHPVLKQIPFHAENYWRPPGFIKPDRDKVAMDAITTALSTNEFNADMFQVLCDIVSFTGREVTDISEYEDEDAVAEVIARVRDNLREH